MKKKKIIFLVILVGVLFLTGCKNSLNTVKEIDFSTLQGKIENKETFILEIVQTGCSHCEEFSPRFREVLSKYDLTGYSINLSNLTEEEKNKLTKIDWKNDDLNKFKERYQEDARILYKEAITRNIEKGRLMIENDYLKATQEGQYVLNDILIDFM